MTIDRRAFLFSIPAFVVGARAIGQVELTGAWLTAATILLQKGAEYLGGKTLSQATNEITNAQVLAAVQSAASDIKRYVVEQTQRMFDEDAAARIRGYVSATDLALRDYASSRDPGDLRTAYENNVLALSFAKEYKFVGLPSFTLALAQRVFVVKARAEHYRRSGELAAFGKNLKTTDAKYIDQTVSDYVALLAPEKRLVNYRCLDGRPPESYHVPRSHFTPLVQACLADLDGRKHVFISDAYYNGDDWDKISALGQAAYQREIQTLRSHQEEVKRQLDGQFGLVSRKFVSLADQIAHRRHA